jgi:hypothetical protein
MGSDMTARFSAGVGSSPPGIGLAIATAKRADIMDELATVVGEDLDLIAGEGN